MNSATCVHFGLAYGELWFCFNGESGGVQDWLRLQLCLYYGMHCF